MKPSFALAVLALAAGSGASFAQSIDDDPQRRRLILPYIRAATDCIAREALSEPGIGYAAREMRLLPALTGPIKRCSYELQRMVERHDELYYRGSGQAFFKGAYLDDLARAVTRRVGGELSRKATEDDARRSAEQAETTRRRAEDERRTIEIRAETERREAERRLAAEKAESDRRAEAIRLADLKRQELANASRASELLKERMYECAAKEIGSLVRSGEGADVLASAAMTLCSSEVDKALDSLIQAKAIEDGSTVGFAEREAVKTAGRSLIRERVMAEAVKAKAARASGSSY